MRSEFSRQGSVALNVVLIITVAALLLHKSNHSPTSVSNGITPQKPSSVVNSQQHLGGTPDVIEQPKLPNYAEIKSPSDRRRLIIDQLRAMGVPNEMLGRVARVDFEVQWDSRFEECHADMDKMAAVQLEMNKSKDAEMRAALGEKDFKEWDQNYMLWEAMSTKVDVTASEADALYGFKKKLQQRLLELDEASLNKTMDNAAIGEATDKAYAEFNQSMKSLLGDERYAKSQQMDEAFVADNFRYQLAKANPTDAQFQELFKTEQEWNQARMQLERQYQDNLSSPEFVEKIQALNNAHDQEYQKVLGADAFNTLQKSQDPVYTQMKKYETLWGLDEDKIDYVYNTMKQYQKSMEDYQTQVFASQSQGQQVDWESVNKKLEQAVIQTQQALQSRLGQDSFNRLQRNHVLRWAGIGYQPANQSSQ